MRNYRMDNIKSFLILCVETDMLVLLENRLLQEKVSERLLHM